jgi:cell division protein FtsW (lipid II flippase)
VEWFISIVAGVAVCFAWAAIWNVIVLHAFGIAVLRRQAEDRASRREHMKQMGKLRYILIFGVLGSGIAFGLGLTTADFLDHLWHGWGFGIAKLVFVSVLFGWFNGARTWSEGFPVPFPPNYPPAK